MNNVVKRILIIALSLIIAIALVIGGYVIYLSVNYYRIEDNTKLKVQNPSNSLITQGTEHTVLTYNIGFGAYNPDFSFFMDVGIMKDGTEVTGKYGRAESKEVVLADTEGVINTAQGYDADIMLFQEVDIDSTRSYHVNQKEKILSAFPRYSSTFASNFHSVFLAYPLNDMHGKVESGILTLSRYNQGSATRRSFPVDESFITKFFDLDRCFSVHRMPVENARQELVLINTHMSAYDKGGKIRKAQMKMISEVMQDEYAAGNWVIVGGDFNHALGGTIDSHTGDQKVPEWVQPFDYEGLPAGFLVVEASNQDSVYTCRGSDIPYEDGVNYETTVDGFIVSNNITASSTNIDSDYSYSDHNPAILTFTLN